MVPKVADKGRSFKGAGLYYLHDKKAATAERVTFTHTVNLPTEDADKAIGWMAHTAMRQAEIKRAAGGVAKGRKLATPVYAYSLSWSPDQQPTQEQMIAAGLETLKRLGLDGHEALFVAHNDEPHPHLHIIANRVNPTNGIAAPLSNDHLKLSEWAEEYERAHGKILCAQRVENNARRKKEFVKDRASQKAAEFHQWRRERQEAEFQRRQREKQDLARKHGQDREILRDVLKELVAARRQEQKENQKPLWAALYRTQREEKQTFEAAQKTTFGRLRYWLKNRHLDRFGGDSLDRQGMLARAFNIVVNRDIMATALAAKQEADRKALSERVRADTAARLAILYRANDKLLARLKQEHDQARAAQRAQHRTEIEKEARRKTRGGDRTSFAFDKARGIDPAKPGLTDTFGAAAKKPPTRARPAFDKAASVGPGQTLEKESPTPAPQSASEKGIEDGEAARMIREARQRGLDESADRSEGEDSQSGGEGGGQAFRAFRDAKEGRDTLPRPEPGKDASSDSAGGGKAFSAFRDARDRKGKDKDQGRDDGGREREHKAPKSPGDK